MLRGCEHQGKGTGSLGLDSRESREERPDVWDEEMLVPLD